MPAAGKSREACLPLDFITVTENLCASEPPGNHLEASTDYLQQIPNQVSAHDLVSLLGQFLTDVAGLERFRIYLRHDSTGDFWGCPQDGVYTDAPIHLPASLPASSPLIQGLRPRVSRPVPTENSLAVTNQCGDFQAARQWLNEWHMMAAISLISRHQLIGVVLLAAQTNGPGTIPDHWPWLVRQVQLFGLFLDHLRQCENRELIGRISRGLAHDMHSFLTPIATCLQLCGAGEKEWRKAARLSPEAWKNLQAIQQCLRYARVYAESPHPQVQSGRLDLLVQDLVTTLPAQCAQVTIDVRVPGPIEILMDEVLIRRLLHNLLANALRASPPGSTITVEVEADPQLPEPQVRLLIRDRGCGMSQEVVDRLSAPTFATATPPVPDTTPGLGIAICQEIVRLHRGQFTIRSRLGQGTLVEIQLPKSGPATQPV